MVEPAVQSPTLRYFRRQVTTVLTPEQYEDVKAQALMSNQTLAAYARSVLTSGRIALLEPELYRELEAIARSNNVTVAAYVRAVLVDVVEEEKVKMAQQDSELMASTPTFGPCNDVQSP